MSWGNFRELNTRKKCLGIIEIKSLVKIYSFHMKETCHVPRIECPLQKHEPEPIESSYIEDVGVVKSLSRPKIYAKIIASAAAIAMTAVEASVLAPERSMSLVSAPLLMSTVSVGSHQLTQELSSIILT